MLGCLGLLTCGVTSLVGLVLGIIALVRINKSNGQLGGQGLALAGTIVSATFLLLVPILGRYAPARPGQGQNEGRRHPLHEQRQAAQPGLIMYASDNKDQLPAGTNWCDALRPYLAKATNVFICPQGAPGQRCHYALNAALAGHETKRSRRRPRRC